MTGRSDERLIRAHARGDERALGSLLERYRGRIASLFRHRLGLRSLWVEDVVQEVFLQVHRRARSFEGRSTFKTWLYAVALNVCRDHVRRQARTGHARADDEAALARLSDTSLDPLELMARAEREVLVRRAVGQLTPAHRLVLRLRDWEDMSYAEIAAPGADGNRPVAPA
jgi:RNA polymerase sigma-70 factor (ECF subfamily)